MCFCFFIGLFFIFLIYFLCISSDGEELWDINTSVGVTWMDPSPSVLDSDHSREMQCSGGDYWVRCPKSHYLGTWGGVMFVIVGCVWLCVLKIWTETKKAECSNKDLHQVNTWLLQGFSPCNKSAGSYFWYKHHLSDSHISHPEPVQIVPFSLFLIQFWLGLLASHLAASMRVTLCADLKLPSKSHSLWAVVSLWCTSVIIDVLKASVPHVPTFRNIKIAGFICLCGVILCDIIITLCICHLLLIWLIFINWFTTFSAVHEKGTFVFYSLAILFLTTRSPCFHWS